MGSAGCHPCRHYTPSGRWFGSRVGFVCARARGWHRRRLYAVRPVFNVFYHRARSHTHTHTHVYAHAHARHGFLETARISPLQGRGLTARGPSLNHGRRRGARRYRFALMGAADRRIPPNAPGRVLRRGRVDPCGEFRDETKIPFVQRVFYFVVVAARVMRVHCLRPAYSKPAFLRLFDVAQH